MTIPRAAGAKGLVPLAALLVLLLIPAGELVAQCEPGYRPVEDCSAQDAHNKGCNQTYQNRLATIAGTYAACLALCDQDDSECSKKCSKANAAAAAGASAAFALCRGRAPACVTRCVKDPSHPRWWCQHWPYCEYSSD
jgi:hypothetical protein